eukprot:761485-Hanusia_phi.AAC.2
MSLHLDRSTDASLSQHAASFVPPLPASSAHAPACIAPNSHLTNLTVGPGQHSPKHLNKWLAIAFIIKSGAGNSETIVEVLSDSNCLSNERTQSEWQLRVSSDKCRKSDSGAPQGTWAAWDVDESIGQAKKRRRASGRVRIIGSLKDEAHDGSQRAS